MFTIINKQGVTIDEGFTVQFISRFEIKYSENLGEIDVPYDSGSQDGKAWIYVGEEDFYKWNDGRAISEQKKRKILNNFIDALEFLGVVVVVE